MQFNLDIAQECIRESIKLIQNGRNEQVIRDSFTSYLRNIFPDTPKWINRHITGSEAAVKIHKDGRKSTGFVDNLIDLTAIEYESNLKLQAKFDEGYNQVKDYCAALIAQGNRPELIVGILSDTVNWFAYTPILIVEGPTDHINRDNIELQELDIIDLSNADENSARRLVDFLEKHLGRIGSLHLNANSIALDLGFKSKFCESHISELETVAQRAFDSNAKYADLVVRLWCNFVTYLHDKGSSANFEFRSYVYEFYILTLGKLICSNFLAGTALISDEKELRNILNGNFFSARGLVNFIEYDYFGWLNESPYVEEVLQVAHEIQVDLQAYNFAESPEEDVFGKLMAQLANRTQRILLGQEWTPSWLAKQIVKNVVDNIPEDQDLQLVDMCCGSGAMVVETVKIAKERIARSGVSADERVHILTKSITGFDIDPLAVMLSKINWLLTSRDWLNEVVNYSISIPIYHADSLFAITPLSRLDDDAFPQTFILKIAEYSIPLPKFIISAEYQRFFDALLDSAYGMVSDAARRAKLDFQREDIDYMVDRLLVSTDSTLQDEQKVEITSFASEFIEKIDLLNRDGRNGIWVYIMRNSYRPGLVAGQFNGLVSNPPWLALSKLADNPYRSFLKKKAEEYSIKPPGPSHLHIELATIFLLHSINRYLANNASIGCITPETVLNGHHQNPFRTHAYLNATHPVDFSIESIWQVVGGTFKNNAIVLFGKKNRNQSEALMIPASLVSSSDQRDFILYIHKQGNRTIWSYVAPQEDEVGFYTPANFRQGADIMPRTLFIYEITNSRTVGTQTFHSIQSIDPIASSLSFAVRDAKNFKDFRITPQQVPDELIYKILVSNLLTPFDIGSPLDALLPIRKNAANIWEVIPNNRLAAMGTVRNVFREICSNYGQDANSETLMARLDVRNKLTQQIISNEGYLVFTGAGGSNVCSAYAPVHSFNLNKLIIDQTIYWATVETEEAAIYLSGLLNSPAINLIIREFQPRGAFGERHIHKLPFAVTPPFDPEQASHQDVVVTTRALIVEYENMKRTDPDMLPLLNPNTAPLSVRRRAIQRKIAALPSFENYAQACSSQYGV